jgi:hypothetical protein
MLVCAGTASGYFWRAALQPRATVAAELNSNRSNPTTLVHPSAHGRPNARAVSSGRAQRTRSAPAAPRLARPNAKVATVVPPKQAVAGTPASPALLVAETVSPPSPPPPAPKPRKAPPPRGPKPPKSPKPPIAPPPPTPPPPAPPAAASLPAPSPKVPHGPKPEKKLKPEKPPPPRGPKPHKPKPPEPKLEPPKAPKTKPPKPDDAKDRERHRGNQHGHGKK